MTALVAVDSLPTYITETLPVNVENTGSLILDRGHVTSGKSASNGLPQDGSAVSILPSRS